MEFPNIYCTPILYKSLANARFMIAALCCPVKPLLKAASAALKVIYKLLVNFDPII